MTHIYVRHPRNHTDTRVTRCYKTDPNAVRLPLWLRKGDRRPRIGEVVDTFREASALYALGTPR